LQGQLILDGGKLHGSFFHRKVVLICQHDEEGAFGLVLNQLSNSKVGEALVANLSDGLKGQPLFVGGPVQPGALSYLHTNPTVLDKNVMNNLSLGHSLDTLIDLGEEWAGAPKFKLFAGYAGWSPGQLDNEMKRKDWLLHPATLDLVFFPEPAELWKKIMSEKDPKSRLMADAPDDLSWN